MYCNNCGAEINENAAVCLKCGVYAGAGGNFCPNCGEPTAPNASVCTNCGVALVNTKNPSGASSGKSKMIAGLLAILLGALGIHNFYLGYTKKAVIQLVISLVGALLFGIGPIAMEIWGIIEGIQIFTGKIANDANGNPLSD